MPLTAADAAHLIRRTGFGVTGPLFHELRGLGSRQAAVERLLDASLSEDDTLTPGAVGFATAGLDLALMQRWWLDRMVGSQAPLVEKLTLFWHGHFVSGADKVVDLNLLMRQNQLLRHHAMGSFHDLVQSISIDPAMLVYLDNHTNVASAPQENFGREVLEVFTLGPGGRTEAEVVAMTRAWTGHGLGAIGEVGEDGQGIGTHYEYHPAEHDNGHKALFEMSPRSWNGPAALSELVLRSRREPMSRFITAKLFSFLAYPVPPEAPEVVRLAEVFRRSGLSIQALTRAILLSDEFWSPVARGALVRSPVEWVVAALQATEQKALVFGPEEFMGQMGQQLFAPPNVAGWGQNAYWLSTARTWGKAAMALQLRDRAGSLGVLADTADLSPTDAANRAFGQFGVLAPAASTRRVVEAMVRRMQAEGNANLVPRNLVHLMLLTPDFQLA